MSGCTTSPCIKSLICPILSTVFHVLFFFFLQLITEQASFTLPRGAEIEGKCGSTESEIHITWKNKAYTIRIYFSKVGESAGENGNNGAYSVIQEIIKAPNLQQTSPNYTLPQRDSDLLNVFSWIIINHKVGSRHPCPELKENISVFA